MAALLPVLLLLLLTPSPALGNEGAAAGSCRCWRANEEPPILRDFPERLQSCQTCPGHMFRFTFPQIAVCGHQTKEWAQSFWQEYCSPSSVGSRPAMRAEGSQPPRPPTPTPGNTIPMETVAPGPVQGTPEGTPRAQLAPGSTTGAPWGLGRARSTPPAREDPAGAGPSRLWLQEEPGGAPAAEGGSRVAVLSLTGLVLVLATVVTLLVCRGRRWGRGRPLAHHGPLPGDEMRHLPCTET